MFLSFIVFNKDKFENTFTFRTTPIYLKKLFSAFSITIMFLENIVLSNTCKDQWRDSRNKNNLENAVFFCINTCS